MLQQLGSALGLVFVIEGLLPFLAPGFWRRAMLHMMQQSDVGLRIFGLTSMLVGLVLLYLIHK
jgi:uncharacterized protein YjeT (DUF2065 family)